MNQNKTAILIHTKHYRDTQGNTYSATICQIGHELALVIPRAYGSPEEQQHRIKEKLTENLGLKNLHTFHALETFLGGTIYRITEKATAREVKAWGEN